MNDVGDPEAMDARPLPALCVTETTFGPLNPLTREDKPTVPASFTILPRRGLVYVDYAGHVDLAEVFSIVEAYDRHPDRHPDQRHLVDLTRVTGFEHDPLTLMKLQARKADIFTTTAMPSLVVYIAPTRVAMTLAQLAMRSWDGNDKIIVRLQQDEAGALNLLGLRHRTVAELLKADA